MFMDQPPSFEMPGKEYWVIKLTKRLYNMKQASRVWNQTFDKVVKALEFERLSCKWCVYRCVSMGGTIIFAMHVDNIVSATSSPSESTCFKNELCQHWEISDLGDAKFALGIAISCNLDLQTITILQTALIDCVIEQINQANANPLDTPMVASLQLCRPDKSAPISSYITSWMQQTPYHSLVGSLMYISCRT